MPNKRIALFAASGFLAALCGLAGPARAQYAYSLRRRLRLTMAIPRLRRWSRPFPSRPIPISFGNQRYCWYDSAWNGPGWYYCGYAFRRGYGWGGGSGWNNWRWAGRGGRGGWGHGGGGYGGGGHYDHR